MFQILGFKHVCGYTFAFSFSCVRFLYNIFSSHFVICHNNINNNKTLLIYMLIMQ